MARKNPANRTTLSEVARQAGVSSATASMVLSGKGDGARIAPATADRVRAAALALDYSPNLLVHSLQRGTSGVLAFFSAFRILPDDDDLYMDRLIRGLERAAGQRGHDLLLQCAFQRSIEETYRSINGGRVDGLLLFAAHAEDPMLSLMRRSRLPCVLLNGRDPEGVLPSVKDDYRTGMWELTEALVAQGHRRIACLDGGPLGTPDAAERIRTLDQTLRAHGVERDPSLNVDISRGLASPLLELFERPEPPTAIFCCTDRVAYRALPILRDAGRRVPEDVSLVGYDGLHWPSDSHHLVDSVAVDLRALTASAVDLLLDGPSGPCELTIPTTILRGTTLGPAS
ncbi:MAG: LacI family DNA-binding transcriptional regulator [Fimbriimonas sp.]